MIYSYEQLLNIKSTVARFSPIQASYSVLADASAHKEARIPTSGRTDPGRVSNDIAEVGSCDTTRPRHFMAPATGSSPVPPALHQRVRTSDAVRLETLRIRWLSVSVEILCSWQGDPFSGDYRSACEFETEHPHSSMSRPAIAASRRAAVPAVIVVKRARHDSRVIQGCHKIFSDPD